MKVPKTFRPKSNLDEKTKKLVKESKINKKIEISTTEELSHKAKCIASYCGKDKGPIEAYGADYYFLDKKSKLDIRYFYRIDKWNYNLYFYEVLVSHKGEKVFKEILFDQDITTEICLFGDWEKDLEKIYKKYLELQKKDETA